MPATSSAPGSQPEAVAKKNQKAAAKATSTAVKAAAKSTAKAVSSSTAITEAASSAAQGVARGTSAPAKSSRPRSGRPPRPEPALQYKPPKPVAVKVKADLKALDSKKADRAARKPIKVAPKLGAEVKVAKHSTLIAPKVARKAVASLPKPIRQQAAQKLKARKQQAQKPKAPQRAPKAERKEVKERLKVAARKSKPKIDVKAIPDMNLSREVAPIVKRMAEKRGLQPSVLMAQLENESGFNPLATEQGGSVSNTPSEAQGGGISQFITSTAAQYGVKYGDSPKAVRSQLRGQANYMQDLGGTTAQALADYYGDGNPNGEYAQNILQNSKRYAALDEPAGKGKPIPQPLREKAKEVLGAKRTRKVIDRAKSGGSASSAPKQLPGPLSGSKKFVQTIVGSKVKSDHGVENEGSVHTPDGDHYAENGYAQDINQPAGNPAENEPPYNQKTLDKIVKNLRKQGADVPDLTIGENWEGSVRGYRVQLLTNEGGTINHIHIGARWEGTPTTTGSTSGTSVDGTAATGGSSTAPSGPAASKAAQASKKRRKRARRRPTGSGIKLTALPAALDPSDYAIDPSVESYAEYIKRAPVSLGL